MAANVWDHSQVPIDPRNMLPVVPNRPMPHNLALQFPMVPEGMSAGHLTHGYGWPQSNPQRQKAVHILDDFGEGDTGSFGDHVGSFNTLPVDYRVEQLLPPTPSPGSTAHGSPESLGSLYEDKMGFYLDEDEPWRPLSVDRGNYKAIQDNRDRTFYMSHVNDSGIVVPRYPDVNPPKPGHNHRGQRISPQAKRMKKYPQAFPQPAVPGRRSRRSVTKSPSERPNTGVSQIFNLNMEPKHKRHRRSFTEWEKARTNAVRKARACKGCHDGKRKCTHVALPSSQEAAPEEPSPTSDAGPVTPTPAGPGNDFILFESSPGREQDLTEDALFSELEKIDAITQVEFLLLERFQSLTY
ncbi:MAG: hypothetical protein Q9195_003305 [Heterodermia aff. obscurata]